MSTLTSWSILIPLFRQQYKLRGARLNARTNSEDVLKNVKYKMFINEYYILKIKLLITCFSFVRNVEITINFLGQIFYFHNIS